LNRPTAIDEFGSFERLLSAYAREQARADQARRGYYDKHGVRQGGLIAFVRHFWHVLEPETKFVDGWSMWAICEHLEGVTFGEITRLLINVPPGFCKSMLVDVFWPAWEWGPMDRAHHRYVCFSYAASLTERDNGRFRDLVTSADFQKLWGDRVVIQKKGETKVSNEGKRGWKLASSVGGVGTGERGDRVILDDPHNVKEVESELVRTETVRWFRESMSNRLNDSERSAIVIIMQRVHEDDISGAILTLELNYEHVMIPMEYDVTRQVDEAGQPCKTSIGWYDPRYDPDAPEQADGTLAWPERFPALSVARTKEEVGPYAWAGQYQQMPTPRGGGIFKRAWWQPYDSPDGKFPVMDYIVASLDSAFTAKQTNNPSALVVLGMFTTKNGDRAVMLVDAWRKHLQMHGDTPERLRNEPERDYLRRAQERWGLVEWIAHTCRRCKVNTLLIEAKASGLSAAQELRRLHGREGWAIIECNPKGDKMARALAAQPILAQGKIWAPDRAWADLVITEMSLFPHGKFDDFTDAMSQAIKFLRDSGILETSLEEKQRRDEEAREQYSKIRSRANLYPV
jgi:predicted phage terminase large subunit-like protein